MNDITESIGLAATIVVFTAIVTVSIKDRNDKRCGLAFEYIKSVHECLDYSPDKCGIGVDEMVSYNKSQSYVREYCQAGRATEWTGQRGIPL